MISGENHPSCIAKASNVGGNVGVGIDGRRAPVPKVTDHIATPLRSRKNYVQVRECSNPALEIRIKSTVGFKRLTFKAS